MGNLPAFENRPLLGDKRIVGALEILCLHADRLRNGLADAVNGYHRRGLCEFIGGVDQMDPLKMS